MYLKTIRVFTPKVNVRFIIVLCMLHEKHEFWIHFKCVPMFNTSVSGGTNMTSFDSGWFLSTLSKSLINILWPAVKLPHICSDELIHVTDELFFFFCVKIIDSGSLCIPLISYGD